MKLITCFNTKGGVGKTTLNLLLGKRLAKEGNKVLFIDADGQSNLTEYFYGESCYDKKTMEDALLNECKAGEVIIKSPNKTFENIDIIPSNPNIADLSERMDKKIAKEKIVARWMKKNIDTLESYDYIIVDLCPIEDLSNRNFLYVMDSIIYVVEFMDIASVKGARDYMYSYEQDLEALEVEDTTEKAILINSMQGRKSTVAQYFEERLEEYCKQDNNKLGKILLKNRLNQSDVIKRSNLENVDLEDITKKYRNKKIEEQFSSIVNELKLRKVL